MSAINITYSNYYPSPVSADPQPAGNPSGGPWTLAFRDEFSDPLGTGQPDWTVWADHFIDGENDRGYNNSNEIEWYDHSHTGEIISGGILSLKAINRGSVAAVQAIDPQCPDPLPNGQHATYTSGMIQSFRAFNFTYGYVESRIQNPSGAVTGWWPAFWMVTSDNAWPPEIDIDEMDVPGVIDNNYINTAGSSQTSTYSEDTSWHVYGMRLDASHVTFFRDGVETYQANYDGNAYPWFIIFNAAVNTSATGAGFPCQWNIDYVRAWTVQGVPGQPVITSVTPSTGIPTAGTLQVAFSTVSGAANYRATAGWVTGYPGSHSFTASGTGSPLTISGLVNGDQYMVTVGASNATGWGIESLPVPVPPA